MHLNDAFELRVRLDEISLPFSQLSVTGDQHYKKTGSYTIVMKRLTQNRLINLK